MQIVNPDAVHQHRIGAMRDFARELDWTPSYEFETRAPRLVVQDHLVVEHGLENSAVISFVPFPQRTNEFDRDQLKSLLAISYNNLIEWHVFVSSSDVRCINNLNFPETDRTLSFDRSTLSEILSGTFAEQNLFRSPSRRLYNSCDDTFIQTISKWKRLLKADFGARVGNANLSALFNALIFARACEDMGHASEQSTLLSRTTKVSSSTQNMREIVEEYLRDMGFGDALTKFLDPADLMPFGNIDSATAQSLIRDFYRPRSAPYDFNFAWMSKHALSRIYERYVSVLEFPDTGGQLSFVSELPEERSDRHTGSVYTPQFVAGFFARYLRENMTPRAMRSLSVVDPACGSGIFLRTLLEQRCNAFVPGTTLDTISEAFQQTYGIDRDPNAVASSKLSLTLLHLVATGKLPDTVNVSSGDAIRMFLSGKFPKRDFGAIVANPPYIKLDNLAQADRNTLLEYFGSDAKGRVNAYLGFIKLTLDIVEANGFVCLVLPKDFLSAGNAQTLRARIVADFDIRCIVDLSEIQVFEGVGTYNILLIVQRKGGSSILGSKVQIARIREFVGPALQACLDRRTVATPYYEVFEVTQSTFHRKRWVLLSANDLALDARLADFNSLDAFLDIKQGFVTGADEVFIRPKAMIPQEEAKIYLDYLPDRAIRRYSLPPKVDHVVFYPYRNGEPLTEVQLKRNYPKSWRYLNENKKSLLARRAVSSGDTPWWRPVRSREPKNLTKPKIVCPHLMLAPRFALDTRGNFAVSHSPFLISRGDESDISSLRFFCAVLNSSVVQWYMQTHAPKYGRGYNRIEVATLKDVPAPDPSQIPTSKLNEVIRLVDRLSGRKGTVEDNQLLDSLICDLYGLLPAERESVMGSV